jgi:uncharacterized protein (TIGR02466 family)
MSEADALRARARSLWSAGRAEEAIAAARAAAARTPDPSALADLGVMLLEARQAEAAADALRKAIAKGLDAAGLWLLLGKAEAAAGRLPAAQRALDAALDRDPGQAGLHNERLQLVWMRTGDFDQAAARLRQQLARAPALELHRTLLAALAHTDQAGQAWTEAQAAMRLYPGSARLKLDAVRLATDAGRPDEALALAEPALAAAPGDPGALQAATVARLAAGHAEQAVASAEALRKAAPDDQLAIALLATAWRAAGDARYRELYAYEDLVRTWRIETPSGWPSQDAFLKALQERLKAAIPYRAHPLDQSTRNAVQTRGDLTGSTDPVIRAFFASVGKLISAHIEALGPGDDPVRRRRSGSWRFHGAWSVLQRAGGRHVDHVHPRGWLSSAFYVATPEQALGGEDRPGWIRFGKPGLATAQDMPAEHFVRPEAGMLVLFPSYMWHGTNPFATDEQRMTVAFDVVPA